jgi:type II secretory pathway pseudopilin PulG
MVEIAISLAVIAFALVAIIGVLPTGMQVQRDNREETIINQDANVFISAIRSGAQGMDDLTNYVYAITNFAQQYKYNGVNQPPTPAGGPLVFGYNSSTVAPFPLNNGFRIIGLLSTPRYVFSDSTTFTSNYLVAYVRSISGSASDKFPQNNADVLAGTFSYRMVSDIIPFSDFDASGLATNMYLVNLQTNLHDFRLIFRWPLLPNGHTGNGRQVFRTMVSGQLLVTTNDSNIPLFFFQPRTYVKAP